MQLDDKAKAVSVYNILLSELVLVLETLTLAECATLLKSALLKLAKYNFEHNFSEIQNNANRKLKLQNLNQLYRIH